MPANTVNCYVIEGDVTVVTDINGEVTNVVCSHFSRLTHQCRKKSSEDKGVGGFVVSVIKAVSDKTVGTKGLYCEFGDSAHFRKRVGY